jgi:hypothetical protein
MRSNDSSAGGSSSPVAIRAARRSAVESFDPGKEGLHHLNALLFASFRPAARRNPP